MNDAFGQRVRAAMAVAQKSGVQIAKECRVSRQAVHKWETGKCAPSSAALIAFVNATACSLEWLLDPNPLDMKSTPRAPDGVHAKTLIRAVIEDLHHEGFFVLARSGNTGKTQEEPNAPQE